MKNIKFSNSSSNPARSNPNIALTYNKAQSFQYGFGDLTAPRLVDLAHGVMQANNAIVNDKSARIYHKDRS